MPVYGDARLVAVSMPGANNVLYGFNTKVDTADSATLGHIDIVTTNPTLPVLFGCNSRKPMTARKIKATGEQNSSFIDNDAIATAKAAGWDVRSSNVTLYKATARSQRFKVKLASGVFFGWKCNTATASRLNAAAQGKADAGIQNVADGDDNVYYGVNAIMFPNGVKITRKKLRGKVPYSINGNNKSITTYVAFDTTPD